MAASRVPLKRVSVVGAGGMVGAATVNALILRNIAAEVLVVDVNEKLAEGQALDIADASINSHGVCRVGTSKEAGQSDVIVITAGFPQLPGQTRAELLGKNKAIMKSICESMAPIRSDAKIVVVANPVDVLTYIVQKYSGLPKNQVFGSGTYLDSGRLRGHLAGMLNVHPRNIQAFVLGEHGDRQFVAWSCATVQNTPLLERPEMKNVDLDAIRQEVMRKAYAIIDAKRATYFGIGMHTSHIVESVLNNAQDVYPVTHWQEEHKAYISYPAAVGANGVEATFPVNLNEKEKSALEVAVKAIQDMCAEADQA